MLFVYHFSSSDGYGDWDGRRATRLYFEALDRVITALTGTSSPSEATASEGRNEISASTRRKVDKATQRKTPKKSK